MIINLPLIETTFQTLHKELAVIPYMLLVVALVNQIHTSDGNPIKIMQIIGKLAIVCLVLASSRSIYSATEHFFLSIAEAIDKEYLKYPLGLAGKIISNAQEEKMGFWKTITGGGVYDSIWLGLMSFMVNMLSFIQVPFLIIQYFIVKSGFLVFPFIITLFMYQSLSGIAFKYVTHILAVMSWPVGFAIANLISFQILNQFNDTGTTGSLLGNQTGTTSGNIAASIASGLVMLFGMVTTPKIMSGLFSSGIGLASAGGEFLRTLSLSKTLAGKVFSGSVLGYKVSQGAYGLGKGMYSKFSKNFGSYQNMNQNGSSSYKQNSGLNKGAKIYTSDV